MPEKCIKVSPGAVPGEIDITVKGPWLHTILFEIPVLAIVNEVYFRNVCKEPGWEEGRKRLQKKMRLVTGDPDQIGRASELQSLMRISYAVFCLKKKKQLRCY